MNISIYLIPFQIRYELNNQTYLIQFNSPTLNSNSTYTSNEPSLSRPFVMPQTATPDVTATFSPTPTPTVTLTPIPSLTPTATKVPDNSPTPTKTHSNNPPTEARINNITGHRQLYILDCESRSAVDLAAFYGVNIDENAFLEKLPRSSNPDTGFVGNLTDPRGRIPPHSYGVHAAPIASTLRTFGLNAADQHGMSLDSLKKEIALGRPVIVWVIGNTISGYGVSYHAPDGKDTIVAPYEHTVIVIGYTPTYFVILDENNIYQRSYSAFVYSWAVLGNMAVTLSQ